MNITPLLKSKYDWNQGQKNAWNQERREALDYLRGDTDPYTSLLFETDRQYPLGRINITRRIIERISLVYMVPPKRYLNGEKDEDYNELTKNKDAALQRDEQLVNLLELVPVRIVWRNGKFDYDILLEFEPIFEDDPMKPVAVTYPIMDYTEVNDAREVIWHYVDDIQSYDYIKSNGNIITPEDMISHSYGMLPVVFPFRDGIPETGFIHTGVSNDLIRTNLGINVQQTNKYANSLFQSFGYGNISGDGIPQDLKVSPQTFTKLPDGAAMGMVTPPDVLGSLSTSIIDDFKLIAKTYHLSDNFVEGTTAESGVALRLRNQELTDDRKSDVTRWRMYEDRIYRIEQAIAKAEAGKNFSDDFAVDYEESIEVLSPQEQREKWDWEVSNGYKDKADILMEQNPDKFTTREEAQTYLAERSSLPAETDLFGSFVDNA